MKHAKRFFFYGHFLKIRSSSNHSWRRAPGPGAGWGRAAGEHSSACPEGRARATVPWVPQLPPRTLALTLWPVCAPRAQARGGTICLSVNGGGAGWRRSMSCRMKMRAPHEISMFVFFCMMIVMRAGWSANLCMSGMLCRYDGSVSWDVTCDHQ